MLVFQNFGAVDLIIALLSVVLMFYLGRLLLSFITKCVGKFKADE